MISHCSLIPVKKDTLGTAVSLCRKNIRNPSQFFTDERLLKNFLPLETKSLNGWIHEKAQSKEQEGFQIVVLFMYAIC